MCHGLLCRSENAIQSLGLGKNLYICYVYSIAEVCYFVTGFPIEKCNIGA
jgi:hypothetical protein